MSKFIISGTTYTRSSTVLQFHTRQLDWNISQSTASKTHDRETNVVACLESGSHAKKKDEKNGHILQYIRVSARGFHMRCQASTEGEEALSTYLINHANQLILASYACIPYTQGLDQATLSKPLLRLPGPHATKATAAAATCTITSAGVAPPRAPCFLS